MAQVLARFKHDLASLGLNGIARIDLFGCLAIFIQPAMLAVPMRKYLLLVVGVSVSIAVEGTFIAMPAVRAEMKVIFMAMGYFDNVHDVSSGFVYVTLNSGLRCVNLCVKNLC